MRVVHINTTDSQGGAAIAAMRLHRGLRAAGVDSHVLVGYRSIDDPSVHAMPRKPLHEHVLGLATRAVGLHYLDNLRSFALARHPLVRSADVLHLHNLHGDYFSYLALPRLARGRRVVLTLHDMWAITGHCSHSYDCQRWTQGCGHCPYLGTYPAVRRDATSLEWRLKRRAWERSRVTVVAPSRWMLQVVQSSMLRDAPARLIPHAIDTNTFCPLSSRIGRDLLNISPDALVVLFAAANVDDEAKGGPLLIEAIRLLPQELRARVHLLTMGNGGASLAERAAVPATVLGHLSNDHLKCVMYSTADVFVLPTRAESFGLVLLESLSCGTPVIASRVGAVPELVRDGQTGYTATAGDAQDFANQMARLLGDPAAGPELRERCRAVVEAEYALGPRVQDMIRVYQGEVSVGRG